MTLGLRCYSPACHRHPASLLVRVPAAKSSLPVLSACALRPRPNLPLRLASSPPSSSFHPDSSQHLPSTRVHAPSRVPVGALAGWFPPCNTNNRMSKRPAFRLGNAFLLQGNNFSQFG